MKESAAIKLLLLFLLIHMGGCITRGNMNHIPNILEKTITLESGRKLRFAISLPRNLSPAKPVPLVLALHYGGRVTPFYGKEFLTVLVEPAFRDLNAIIVAPDCPVRGWNNLISEKAIMTLIDFMKQNYNIDKSRILITGYSMGGIGTWYFAAKYPSLFSAAIPISALPDPKTTPVIKEIPLYVIHSRNDEVFPLDRVRNLVDKQRSGGASIHFVIVNGISHYETYRFVKPLMKTIPWIKQVWKKRYSEN